MPPRRGAIAPNNANLAVRRGGQRPNVRHRLDASLRETKPNLGALGYLGDRTRDARPDAPNKPNSRPGLVGRGPMDVVQTNQNPAAMPMRRSAFLGGRLCQTKPNSGRMGYLGNGTLGKCAKQTQFRPAKPVVQTKPIPGSGGDPGQIVRNEPSLSIADCGFRTALRRDAACGPPAQRPAVQTNPIRANPTRVRGAIMPNKAKLGCHGVFEWAVSALAGADYAKQTQFRLVGPPRAECARRSHLPYCPRNSGRMCLS
jgi:hypothetical protein